jgi:hypothetical protein
MLAGIAIKPMTKIDVLWDILAAKDPRDKPDVRQQCLLNPLSSQARNTFGGRRDLMVDWS